MLCVAALARNGFEIDYVTGEGASRWVPLAEAWPVPFEHGMPVRRFTSRKGQRHMSGTVVVGDHGWARGV